VIYTSEELAFRCGCKLSTIQRKARDIGGRKVRGYWVFSEESVAAMERFKIESEGHSSLERSVE
jgi:hypothetical protein